MSGIPAATEDRNIELLHASERIQKLTVAADALVARNFILSQEDDILDCLERYVAAVEADVQDAESLTMSMRTRCALLRPNAHGPAAGEDSEVTALWRQHGASMARLLRTHAARLVKVEETLAAAAAAKKEEAQRTPVTTALDTEKLRS